MRKIKPSTAYMLKGLIPYTMPNLKLSFKPNAFFNELEAIDRKYRRDQERIKASAFRQEYYRAKSKGLIMISDEGVPGLTPLGKRELAIFEPEQLEDALLLVTFDIEERLRWKRREFRSLLKALRFKQAQKSVWISKYDSINILREEIERLKLKNGVKVYEARSVAM